MTTFPRLITSSLIKDLFSGKVIVLTGARQVGKTTLVKNLPTNLNSSDILWINADNPTDREIFTTQNLESLIPIVANYKLVVIDEAQRITDIGLTIKLLVDHYQKEKQVILTGSSSLHLLDQTSEALTGRKFVHHLYPISYEEIMAKTGTLSAKKSLDSLLVYGSYPEVLLLESAQDKIRRLQEIQSSYLFRDILEFQSIKNPQILHSFLKTLAFQIGSEVSYSELGNIVGLDVKTIEKYIDLLEKSFVIFRLPAFSQHHKREISKNKKIFFYDLGIRNATINNFNSLASRDDVGRLWENFVIVERLKYRSYHQISTSQYFWRTYDGSEIDLVEERDGKLFGYEIKHQSGKSPTIPTKWSQYKNSVFSTITPSTLNGFIC